MHLRADQTHRYSVKLQTYDIKTIKAEKKEATAKGDLPSQTGRTYARKTEGAAARSLFN